MKINFAVCGATLAGACAASVLVVAPAKAAVIGDSLVLGFNNTVETGTTTNFTSFNVNDPIATAGVLGVFDTVTLNDLTIEDSNSDNVYDFVNTDQPWKVYSIGGDLAGLTASFFIESGSWSRQVLSGNQRNYSQIGDFVGFYQFSDGREFRGFGQIDLARSSAGSTGTGFLMTQDVTPIPTPALLPGLLGMGAAAFRKRKSADA